jgi:hypothetical protein
MEIIFEEVQVIFVIWERHEFGISKIDIGDF